MGGHHGELPKIPDYRIYKLEDAPELMAVKEALARRKLKDPWLRNYVWMYTGYNKGRANTALYFGGWKYGLVAAVVTTVLHKAFLKYMEPEDTHH